MSNCGSRTMSKLKSNNSHAFIFIPADAEMWQKTKKKCKQFSVFELSFYSHASARKEKHQRSNCKAEKASWIFIDSSKSFYPTVSVSFFNFHTCRRDLFAVGIVSYYVWLLCVSVSLTKLLNYFVLCEVSTLWLFAVLFRASLILTKATRV